MILTSALLLLVWLVVIYLFPISAVNVSFYIVTVLIALIALSLFSESFKRQKGYIKPPSFVTAQRKLLLPLGLCLVALAFLALLTLVILQLNGHVILVSFLSLLGSGTTLLAVRFYLWLTA